MSLLDKLLEIQKEVDHFTKDKKGFNYTYTTGNQVLSKIRPKMNQLGVLLKQEVISVVNERIDYVNSKGYDKSEILSSVAQRFTWIDCETGEREECLWHGNGMNDWDKGLGSALTYGERYFLLKFFHVPTDEDDNDNRQDNSGYASKKEPKKDEPEKKWLNATDKQGNLNKTGEATARKLASGEVTWKEIHEKCKVSKADKKAVEDRVKEI
jgi:hypothetical protein